MEDGMDVCSIPHVTSLEVILQCFNQEISLLKFFVSIALAAKF